MIALVALAVALTQREFRQPKVELPSVVAQDYRAYLSGNLPLTLLTADVKRMERFFVEQGVPFETRVFDLGMMSYGLLGGRTHLLAGRSSALFVYRGPNRQALICQMYRGGLSELPAPDERRENNGVTFLVYRKSGLTLVFWPEGPIVCVLVGEGDVEAIVQLAFAKAMRVTDAATSAEVAEVDR